MIYDAEISVCLRMVEAIVEDEPQLAADLAAILGNVQRTEADWAALRQKVMGQTIADNASEAAAPGGEGSTVSPPVSTAAVQSKAPISQPGASVPAYLADGTPNPAFVHKP